MNSTTCKSEPPVDGPAVIEEKLRSLTTEEFQVI